MTLYFATLLIIILSFKSFICDYIVPPPNITAYEPHGIQVTLTDTDGISVAYLWFNINKKLGNSSDLEENVFKVDEADEDGQWTIEDDEISLNKGDTIYYMLQVTKDGIIYKTEGMSYEVKEMIPRPTTTTTSTTTVSTTPSTTTTRTTPTTTSASTTPTTTKTSTARTTPTTTTASSPTTGTTTTASTTTATTSTTTTSTTPTPTTTTTSTTASTTTTPTTTTTRTTPTSPTTTTIGTTPTTPTTATTHTTTVYTTTTTTTTTKPTTKPPPTLKEQYPKVFANCPELLVEIADNSIDVFAKTPENKEFDLVTTINTDEISVANFYDCDVEVKQVSDGSHSESVDINFF